MSTLGQEHDRPAAVGTCCHMGQPGDMWHIAGCPRCVGVIARRAASEANVIRREARIRTETGNPREASHAHLIAPARQDRPQPA